MPMLDRNFWLELLRPVHVLVLDPDTDWRAWATDALNRAQERIGIPIPLTSQPQPNDDRKLRSLLQELGVHEPFRENDVLDRIFHLLQDGELVVDSVFNEKVFFLLYRLIE